MNLINKQKKANPNWCKNITHIFYQLTYFFLVVKLSIFELKQLFTLPFSHDAKKYVLKLRTQLVFLRKRRHCLVPVFLGFSRRKKRFASSHLNQSILVLKTYSQDEGERHLQDVFKTSSSRLMFAGKVTFTFTGLKYRK